jgi:hypothetical protein
MFIIMMFISLVFAKPDDTIIVEDTRANFQAVQVYIDISEVHAPDGSVGTSKPLNILLANKLHRPENIKRKMHRWASPEIWKGSVDIFDWTNVIYMPTYSNCDYRDAVKCGIQNGHWTVRTVITIGKKYSTITMKLYDNKGRIIGRSSNTTWGYIRWNPRWKLTKIKEQGAFGDSTREIFEMWPPEIEEIPPLIKPFNIGQAAFGVYDIEKRACTVKSCRSK